MKRATVRNSTAYFKNYAHVLTYWGWVTHLYISTLTIIGSDNSLLSGRRQTIIWTNAGILLIRPSNFNEILIEFQTFSLKKIHFRISSAKCRPFRLGLNVLTLYCNLVASNFVPYPSGLLHCMIARQPMKWPCGIWIISSELILGLRPANERRRYFVTMSLIGWAQA